MKKNMQIIRYRCSSLVVNQFKNDLELAMNELDGEGILKTTSFGYDGKGQLKISKRDTLIKFGKQ